MGLSSEERVSKMYWALHHWRSCLVVLHDAIPTEYPYTHYGSRDIVNSWIKRVDRMAGHTTALRDSNPMYWFLGSKKDNYSSMYTELTHLGIIVGEKSDSQEYPSIDLCHFTGRIAGSSSVRHEALVAAAWWSMWYCIDSLLYPVNRYKDGLFPESFHEQLYPLMGEMMHRRYELMAGEKKDDVTKEVNVEQALLSRWKLYGIMREQQEPEYPMSRTRLTQEEAKKRHEEWDRKRYDAAEDLIPTIRNMSLVKVVKALKKAEKEEYDRKDKIHTEQWEKDQAQTDGIFGPMARTQDELEKILRNSLDRAEVLDAAEEMYEVYHCSSGWEWQLDQRLAAAKKLDDAKKPSKKSKKPVKRTKK